MDTAEPKHGNCGSRICVMQIIYTKEVEQRMVSIGRLYEENGVLDGL